MLTQELPSPVEVMKAKKEGIPQAGQAGVVKTLGMPDPSTPRVSNQAKTTYHSLRITVNQVTRLLGQFAGHAEVRSNSLALGGTSFNPPHE